jgi:hypothetical protein
MKLIVLLLLCVSAAGCVERVLYIKGDPPDARIFLNGKEVTDPTPVKINFDYYGDFEILIVKEGFNSRKIVLPVGTPWYQLPILDFIFEVLVPFKIQDTRRIEYTLDKTEKPVNERSK